MATFSIDFLGCKVSHVDAQAIRERLTADGHTEARRRRRRRRRQHVLRDERGGREVAQGRRRLARTHGRVYVTGCAANLRQDAFEGVAENVVVVRRRARRRRQAVAGHVGAIGCVQDDARLDRVRAFVKVQDGCSFSCGFCVIPVVRGASRSRRAEAVLAEVERRVEQGHREIVLTGINLGCYRDREPARTCRALVREAGRDAWTRTAAAVVDRGQPRRRGARRRSARHADSRAPPPRPAAVGRRRGATRDGTPLHGPTYLPTPRARSRTST